MKDKSPGFSLGNGGGVVEINDLVERGARALGKDCGCSGRRDSLNRMFPYKKNK